MRIRDALKRTIPELHGLFADALGTAEGDFDKSDRIFEQAHHKAETLFHSVDRAFENDWAATDLHDEIVEWLTEGGH